LCTSLSVSLCVFSPLPKDTNDINDLMEICSDVVYLHMMAA
jgi:hypothetical protein